MAVEKKLELNFVGLHRLKYIEQRVDMSDAEVACYIDLMVYAGRFDGYLPDDETLWRKACRRSPKAWETILPKLQKLMVQTEKGWSFPFVLHSLKAAMAATSRGKAGGTAKSLKNKESNVVQLETVYKQRSGNKKEEIGKIDTEYEDRPSSLTATSREETLSPSGEKEYFYENGFIKLNEKDFRRWELAYPKLELRAELEALAGWSELTPRNWFHAIPQALRNRNQKITRSGGKTYFSV